MTIGNFCCAKCKHYCFNFGDGSTFGCRAFPHGIPDKALGGYAHTEVINGQVGDFIFEEAKYEDLPEVGKFMWNRRSRFTPND